MLRFLRATQHEDRTVFHFYFFFVFFLLFRHIRHVRTNYGVPNPVRRRESVRSFLPAICQCEQTKTFRQHIFSRTRIYGGWDRKGVEAKMAYTSGKEERATSQTENQHFQPSRAFDGTGQFEILLCVMMFQKCSDSDDS